MDRIFNGDKPSILEDRVESKVIAEKVDNIDSITHLEESGNMGV